MIRATSIVRRPAVKAERVVATLTLDHEARQRRRIMLTAEGGLEFLLDLAGGGALEEGDALKLEDGRLVRIGAAPERLLAITTDNPLRLMRVGWHLGNRHVATEITADAIYILDDHVLVEMVRGLGAIAVPVERPFRPERGAYEGGHHGHDHHDHGHSHNDGHSHAEAHAHGQHAVAHAQAHSHDHAAGSAHEHRKGVDAHDHHDHDRSHGHSHDHSHDPAHRQHG